jgi:hypothetical protein
MAGMLIGKAVQDSGLTLLARVLGAAGAPVTQASLTSIAYAVQDVTTGVQIGTGALTIGTVIFDTLQTDAVWVKDAVGYNFKATLASTLFANGGDLYQIDVKFVPVSGQQFKQSWRVYLQKVYG